MRGGRSPATRVRMSPSVHFVATKAAASTDRLMLLDTASIYFRAYHAIPDSITAPDGTPVNAVRGLIDVIARLIRERRPTRMVACLDADWRPEWRVAAVPAYQAQRIDETTRTGETMADTVSPQGPIIEEGLAGPGHAMGGVRT